MIITVDLYNSKPAYKQITDAVREAIAIGALKSGDRLPPIRETAVNTRVNRNTVSRAYLELEHQGLVQARQGSGYYVTESSADDERQARREMLLFKVRELLGEANLAGMTNGELLDLIKTEAKNGRKHKKVGGAKP